MKKNVLLTSIFIVGMCSLVYELLISTVASYFIGDSIKSFSLVIGFYMASMGLGSYLSKYFNKNLILSFIKIELLLGFIGGLSVPILYTYFNYADFHGFHFIVILLVCLIGLLTGFEIPLISRILESEYLLKENLSKVLSLDYAGALLATLLFPFFFIPFVGNLKSALFFGLVNIVVGLLNYWFFKQEIQKNPGRAIRFMGTVLIIFLGAFYYFSNDYIKHWNQNIFKYPVIYETQSPYQKITLTKHGEDLRLYLNNAIQFSSRDEYRYHEAIVHPPITNIEGENLRVLVLGGGEGLVARELLKYPQVAHIKIIDIDPKINQLAANNPLLVELNEGALLNDKVEVSNEDAFAYLNQDAESFDLIIADLPDPNTQALARLYSTAFYKLILQRLSSGGVFITQATSPDLSPNAFWSIMKTLNFSGFNSVIPLNTNVPSFGNWGFVMASERILKNTYNEKIKTKSLDSLQYEKMKIFPKEHEHKDIKVNYLDRPVILEYYLDHWSSLIYEKR